MTNLTHQQLILEFLQEYGTLHLNHIHFLLKGVRPNTERSTARGRLCEMVKRNKIVRTSEGSYQIAV